MKRIFKLIFILLLFFTFKIVVNANGFTCNYDVNIPDAGREDRRGISELGTIKFFYDDQSTNNYVTFEYDHNPKIVGVGAFILDSFDDQVPIKYFQSNSKYVCPNLVYKFFENSYQYILCFNGADCFGTTDVLGSLQPSLDSKVDNSSSKPEDVNSESLKCNYYYHKGQGDQGYFTFEASKDTKKNIKIKSYLRDSYNDVRYEFDGLIMELKSKFSCPKYLDIEWGNSFTPDPQIVKIYSFNNKFVNTTDEVVANADDNQAETVTSYINKSENLKITVKKINNEYKFYFKNGIIKIDNYDEFKNDFETGNYTKFIIYYDSKYEFLSASDENSLLKKATKVYISERYLDFGKAKAELPNIITDYIEKTCDNIIGNTFMGFLQNNVFKLIYIAIPILLIALTIFDYVKVILNGDENQFQKNWKNFLKRVIVSILILITPSIIMLIAKIIGVETIADCIKSIKDKM